MTERVVGASVILVVFIVMWWLGLLPLLAELRVVLGDIPLNLVVHFLVKKNLHLLSTVDCLKLLQFQHLSIVSN